MTDHLPECFYYMDDFGDGEQCICDRLHACEQRSYALGIQVGKHDGWVAGHAAGVQAAVEAVKAYADERLVLTKHPNASEDITAALRVAAKRIEALGGKQ